MEDSLLGASKKDDQNYGSISVPSNLRTGSSDVREQTIGNCLSHALSTAIRNTMTWIKANCDDKNDINIPSHNEILELLTPIFSPGDAKPGLRSFCAQVCFSKKLIDRISASYFLEPFIIDTKEQLIDILRNHDLNGTSVVMSYILEPRANEFLKYNARYGDYSKSYWDIELIGYETPRRDPYRIPEAMRNRPDVGRNSPYYLPTPVFKGAPERFIDDSKPKPELAAHAVYVSGIGVDKRYKDGDPDFRNCDACATGPDGWGQRSFSDSDKEWYANNPGKFRPGCTCVVETPYIEIKNSWGSGWGDDGYLKIALDYIKDENIVPISLEGGLSGLCSALCSDSPDKNSNIFSFIGLRPVNCRRGGEGKSDESVDTSKVGVSKGAGKRRRTKRMKKKRTNRKRRKTKKRRNKNKRKTKKKRRKRCRKN